ncbi:MAG: tetratricopeptide repeat protein [Thermoleophilia bacterium]|nr:tetratricopeptide repeat protein [Thermoleophilia bacterium]
MNGRRGTALFHPSRRHLLASGVALVIVAAVLVAVHLLNAAGSKDKTPANKGTGDRTSVVVTVISTPPTVSPTPGRVQPSRDQWEALLPRLEAAVAAAPEDINLKRKLALAYYNLGLFEQAVELYEEMLAIKEDAVLRNRLGNTLRDMGNPKGAEQAYRRAIADDPGLPQPYCNLAELLWRQGRNDEALAILEQGLQAVPADKQTLLRQAYQAIQAYRTSTTLAPDPYQTSTSLVPDSN